MSRGIEETNGLAFEYSKAAVPEITTLCEPFLAAFGLTSFIYGRLFYDGKYIFLSNQIDWVKNWLQNVDTIADSLIQSSFQNVSSEEPLYFLWDTANFQEKHIQMNNRFGLWHGFDIYNRLEDSIEGWSFSTSQDRNQLNYFYFKNLNLFHRFCAYLREKAVSLFDMKCEEQFAIFRKNCDFSFNPSVPNAQDVNAFLPSLFLNSYSVSTQNGQIKLSKREIDCMFHLSQGKTSKEIGRILNISPRTVETHFMNIKLKTGCYSKSVLVDTLRDNVLKWL